MIIKNFELNRINTNKQKIILLYGNNQGHKEQVLEEILKPILPKNIFKYEETDIIKTAENFNETLVSKSFFENEKLIIINRASDKIFQIIEGIVKKEDLDDVYIILLAGILDKKSKIRKLFEKENKTVCVPFYEDNEKSLNIFTQKFFRNKKINISQQVVDIVVQKAKGDRLNLIGNLQKLESLSLTRKKLNVHEILKISSLVENHEIIDLVDYCFLKNKRKINLILNENNYSNEDSILINKSFLNRAKKIYLLSKKYEINKDIELTISSAKPALFWKEKEMIKKQIQYWPPQKMKEIIYESNIIDLEMKKNFSNSLNLITNFIFEICSSKFNSST